MTYQQSYVKLDMLECPIARLLGVWLLTLPPNYTSTAMKRTGFLFHLILDGEYNVKVNGTQYKAETGDIVLHNYSHIDHLHTVVGPAGIAFYSVWFSAPDIDHDFPMITIFPASKEIFQYFEKLHKISFELNKNIRNLQLFTSLLELLAAINDCKPLPFYHFDENSYHVKIEFFVRKNGNFRPTLNRLCKICRCSRPTLIRQVHRETGLTPSKFVQRLRMNEACSLLRCELTPTRIAECLHYPSIHSFSREFSSYFGYPPSQFKLL